MDGIILFKKQPAAAGQATYNLQLKTFTVLFLQIPLC